MKIKLLELNLRNFKGIKDFTLSAEGKNVSVYGDNATGKTTLFDAFTWLLFDKDSGNNSKFNIKTLDKNNNVIHGLEHEVSARLDIDKNVVELKKIYKEKWTKKRGEAERTLTGHTTDYFINDVPKKMSEYNNYLSNIIDEETFKILTNPLHFNESLNWKSRRNIALELCGEIEDEKVFKEDDSLLELKPLLRNKTVEDLKDEYKARRRKLNEELKSIPYRIDELAREDKDIDVIALTEQKKALESELKSLKEVDEVDYDFRLRKINGSITVLENELKQLEQEGTKKLREQLDKAMEEGTEIKYDYNTVKSSLNGKKIEINDTEKQIEKLNKRVVELRSEFKEMANERFDTENKICPTCKQSLPEENIKKHIEEFEDYKKQTLKEINEKGKESAQKFEQLKEKLENLKEFQTSKAKKLEELISKMLEKADEVKTLEEQIESIDVANSPEYVERSKKLDELIENKKETEEMKDKQDNTKEIYDLENKILEVDKQLAKVELIKDNSRRIDELKDKERELAQMVAKTEKVEMLCDKYVIVKANLLESMLNSKFKQVEFKLFDVQVNGGIDETFVTTVDGVPFEDLNTAMKINAGLDIIETLSRHYDLKAPIFLDNRESVNKIVKTDAQVINLIVSKHKNLRVQGGE